MSRPPSSTPSPVLSASMRPASTTPPGGSRRGSQSRKGSREATPEGTMERRGSMNLLDDSEVSPLKQFQRMKENGTLKLSVRKKRHSTDGSQSDQSEAAPDKERVLRMSMTMTDIPSRRSSNIIVTGAGDLNGAGPSLLRISSEVNIHASKSSLRPSDSCGNVSNCTAVTTSSNSSSMFRNSLSTSSSSLQKHQQQMQQRQPSPQRPTPKEPEPIYVKGEPIYAPSNVAIKPVITAPEHPISRKKPPIPSTNVPLEKPKIDVKLVRNERPRSSYRMISRSVEELDRSDDGDSQTSDYANPKFLRHAGSNLRNSFIEKKRTTNESTNEVQNAQNIAKSDESKPKTPEEIYSLPQPQSYSESTLKAVKKITDKYDTLEMRKLRASSFRESNKSGSSEPTSPVILEDVDIQTETRESTPEISQKEFLNKSQEDITATSDPRSTPPPVLSKPSKPPLPPMPPPSLKRSSLRRSPQVQGPTDGHPGFVPSPTPPLSVIDPDAEDDSAFMLDSPDQFKNDEDEVEDEEDSDYTDALIMPKVISGEDLEPNTEGEEVICVTSGLTQKDISRIDLFFRSCETDVVVSQCLVDLLMGTADPATGVVDTWSTVCHTGLLVLVLNSGLGRRRREMFIVLAERETGFPLWQDRVNHLTGYKESKGPLHQLQPSNNMRLRVGLKFHCTNAATDFLNQYRELTADPNDDLWKVASAKLDKRRRAKLKRIRQKKQPAKGDISQPCNFSHVTKLDPKDYVHYESVQDLLTKSPINSRSSKGSGSKPKVKVS